MRPTYGAYYSTMCKSWQKLASQAVSHMQEHVHHGHTMEASSMHLATMTRPNGSREFIDPWMVQPQPDVFAKIPCMACPVPLVNQNQQDTDLECHPNKCMLEQQFCPAVG